MSFIDNYGLINSRTDEVNAENAILWTYQNIILTDETNINSDVRREALEKAFNKCRISNGLYHQNPAFAISGPQIEKDKYMSPDQLLTICGASYRYRLTHAKDIWKEIKRQKFRYDNINPDNPKRYIRPNDLVFYGYSAGSFICKLLVILISLGCVISCLRNKNETSGKLLAYIKCKSLERESFIMRCTFKICTYLVNLKNSGWGDVFSIYFKDKNHPNNTLARRIYG